MAQNIADKIYSDFYKLIEKVAITGMQPIYREWGKPLIVIGTIAIVVLGYKQMFGKNPNFGAFIKHLAVIVIFFLFIEKYDHLIGGLRFLFIDFPVAAGESTIKGLASGMQSSGLINDPHFDPQSSINFNPATQSNTAFGALWSFSTAIGDKLIKEGGWTDWSPILFGILMYLIAIILLVFQIIMMAVGLLMATVAILATPFFSWMILFKPLRPMFEKWLTMGFAGGILLYLLVCLLGIVITFTGTTIYGFEKLNNYSIFDPNATISGINLKASQTLATLFLFSAIAIKLIPYCQDWANSISAFSARGMTDAMLSAVNPLKSIGASSAKWGKDAAEKAKGRAGAALNNLRDRMMMDRMAKEYQYERTGPPSEPNRSQPQLEGRPSSTQRVTGESKDKLGSAEERKRLEEKPSSPIPFGPIPSGASPQGDQKRPEVYAAVERERPNNKYFEAEQQYAPLNNERPQPAQTESPDYGPEPTAQKRVETSDNLKNETDGGDGHGVSQIDRQQNAATERLRNKVSEIESSGLKGEPARQQLSYSYNKELDGIKSAGYSSAEMTRLKTSLDKEFKRLNDKLKSSTSNKKLKKNRQESKELEE